MYSQFVDERLKNAVITPLSDIIPKNKLALFDTSQVKQNSRTMGKFASMKTNCALFSRLYISCQVRQGDLDKFFQHENQPCLPSLSEMGQLRQGTKSDLLDCLAKCAPTTQNNPQVDAKVLDGAAIVHMLKPRGCLTFKDYANLVFLPYVASQLENVDRIDIVWDQYLPESLKLSTRERRMSNRTNQ